MRNFAVSPRMCNVYLPLATFITCATAFFHTPFSSFLLSSLFLPRLSFVVPFADVHAVGVRLALSAASTPRP